MTLSTEKHLNHQQVANFYNEVYHLSASSEVKASRHLQNLAGKIDLKPGQAILDVACGAGDWLQVAAGRGLAVSGIDISERAIEVCRRRMPEGQFHVGPAETLPFPDGQFDVVTCLGSLEHFLDQPGALMEMGRVLKPGGNVLILVPNAGFLSYRLGFYKGTQQQTVRETIRSLDEWDGMFGAAGLKVVTRWRDLHVLSASWILRAPWVMVLPRLLQALALTIWPLSWQYQVYHLCQPCRARSTD